MRRKRGGEEGQRRKGRGGEKGKTWLRGFRHFMAAC